MLAFVDEYGENNLNLSLDDISSHFIVTAILLKEENLRDIEKKVEVIRKKFFQTGEIKSSKIGSDDNRRLKILQSFHDIDFMVYSLVVDKAKLTSQGYRYKESFYKNLVGILYKDISRHYKSLSFNVDEMGSKEFMKAFAEYLNRLHPPDLFGTRLFGFINSRSSLIIQMADFFTGTIARAFDSKKKSPLGSSFINSMKDKLIDILEWPYIYQNLEFDYSQLKDDDSINKQIVEYSILQAENYIALNENANTPDDVLRIDCVKYLLLIFRNIDINRYIPTNEIIRHLNFARQNGITTHYFRTEIIGRLRDKGILICSSSNMRGYKYPSSLNNLYEFFNFYNTIITPMIQRINKCNNAVKLLSNNEIDLLEKEEYKFIKNALKNDL